MGSKGSNRTTTNTTQSYTPDPNIRAAGYQALGQAETAAGQPFQMPVAPVAGFSPFQNQAFNQIQGMQGMSLPYFDAAQQYMRGSASPISEQDVGQYYNPMASNVTAQLQNIFGQQNRQATANAVRGAGGVGADRIGVAQGNLANQQTLAAGQVYSSLYDKALAAAQQQKQMMAGAGYGLGQLGPAAQASYLQGTGALSQAGAQQQALDQAQQNAIYQQRLAQIAYPFQTGQYLAGVTGSLAPALGGTTQGQSVTERPTPSPLNQILGIGGSLLGMAMGGPGGAMLGGSLGKGAGSAIGSTYGASDMGGGFGYGSYGGVPVPTYFRRGGKVIDLGRHEYSDGGSTYGKIASQQFSTSHIGNPYADIPDDDSNYADGGDVDETPPLPGSRPMPLDTTSIVPKIPFRPGAGHSGLYGHPEVDVRHQDDQPQSNTSSTSTQVASLAARMLPMLMAANRGGAVNPFDAGQGFADGGDIFPDEAGFQPPEPELLQGIDAPRGNPEPHWTLDDLKRRAGEFYSEKGRQVADAFTPNPQSPFNVRNYIPDAMPQPLQSQAEAAVPPTPKSLPMAPTDELSMADPFGGNTPLPRGNPRNTAGVRSTMASEWAKEGMTPVGIQGVNMNVNDESKFDYTSRHFDQPHPKFRGTEAQNSHGLYQEGGDEWNRYQAWLEKNAPGADWRDPALQSRFTAQNLKENYPQVWKAMQDAKTPGEAADAFLRGYLKPAAQHVADRSRRYLGGEENPYTDRNIVANRDMTLNSILRNPDRPYPDALKRDWGQNFARSPWSALVVGGARMAQTTGPVGSALGAGIEAGVGHLEGQRKQLRTEEDLNQKADALFQHAKTHLDKYQRMTPYEDAISRWREAKATGPTTALQKNAQWLVDNGIAPDIHAAYDMAHSGINQPVVMERAIRAEKANLAKSPEGLGMNDAQLEQMARKNVQDRFESFSAKRGVPGSSKENPLPMEPDEGKRKPGMWYKDADGSVKKWVA